MSEVPKYRLLADAFFSPKLVKAGSIVATHASPGPHMQPLNAAAEARMEEWYNEEHPTLGKDGEPNLDKMYKPHAMHRIKVYEPGEVHEISVLAEPSIDRTGELSLAQSVYAQKDTDQRPGPAQLPLIDPEVERAALAEQSGAAVLEEGKEADPLKAGIKVK